MGKLRLSQKEHRRLEELRKVKKGEITLSKAAELSSVSYRQVLRI
jgi:predicted HTH domain antitoxin